MTHPTLEQCLCGGKPQLSAENERLKALIAEHEHVNSNLICTQMQALNQRDAAQAEADKLRSQITEARKYLREGENDSAYDILERKV